MRIANARPNLQEGSQPPFFFIAFSFTDPPRTRSCARDKGAAPFVRFLELTQ